jgi:HK97 gp10 family phage protein
MVTVKLEGPSQLLQQLNKLSNYASKQAQREMLRSAAEPIRKEMEALAPHEPGKPDLRDSMVISTARGQDSQEVAMAVGPHRGGFYGSFQEFGTSRHAAQPFARPAFDKRAPDALDILADEIWFSIRHGIDRF